MYEVLKDIRIVDLTTTYLGPYATQFLGDMGADIVKVEPLCAHPRGANWC